MSDYDDDDVNERDSNELPAALRKQLKAKDKELAEIREQFKAVASRDRERTLSDALTSRGLNAKVAKLLPADLDLSPESIDAWLTDYADVFGLQKPAVSKPAEELVAPPVPDAWQRIQNISQTASSESGESAVLHSISNATSEQDLIKMILDAGGGAA